MRGSAVGKALAIGTMNVRRFVRDRTNLFFVFILPIAIVVLVGLQFGGDETARLGVVGGAGETVDALLGDLRSSDDIELVDVDDVDDLVGRLESTKLDAGIVLPGDLDARIDAGRPAEIRFIAGTTRAGGQLGSVVDRSLARVLAVPAAVKAARDRGADPAAARAAAERLAPGTVERVRVRTVTAGDRLFPEGTEGFDVAAPAQLVLFTFLTGLTGSSALILTRQLGISRRMMSTPTSVRSIIFGEALGRLFIGIIQGLYILIAALVVFGVNWGDPLGAVAILAAIAAVSAGAAMCFGTFFSNPEQAGGIGTIVSLALAALGGAMLPLELFSDTLTNVARLTPHYWAITAYAELVRHDGTLLDIGTQLAVLLGFAVVLLLVASWRMRVALTR